MSDSGFRVSFSEADLDPKELEDRRQVAALADRIVLVLQGVKFSYGVSALEMVVAKIVHATLPPEERAPWILRCIEGLLTTYRALEEQAKLVPPTEPAPPPTEDQN